jgi:hypothetical protein
MPWSIFYSRVLVSTKPILLRGTISVSMSWMNLNDCKNKITAIQKAMEFDDRIPIGLLYREDKATYHQKNTVLSQVTPLLDRKTDSNFVNQLIKSYI